MNPKSECLSPASSLSLIFTMSFPPYITEPAVALLLKDKGHIPVGDTAAGVGKAHDNTVFLLIHGNGDIGLSVFAGVVDEVLGYLHYPVFIGVYLGGEAAPYEVYVVMLCGYFFNSRLHKRCKLESLRAVFSAFPDRSASARKGRL